MTASVETGEDAMGGEAVQRLATMRERRGGEAAVIRAVKGAVSWFSSYLNGFFNVQPSGRLPTNVRAQKIPKPVPFPQVHFEEFYAE